MPDLPRALVLGLLLAACDPPPQERAAPSASSSPAPIVSAAPTATGSMRGARELLERFIPRDANRKALAAALTPKPGDAAAVFTGELAQKAEAHYLGRVVEIVPTAEQTELLLWKATSEELRAGTGDAVKCASGYGRIALQPKLTWYCFKFVKPAEKSGTESEGLIFVNGHWALFPAPWDVK